MTDSETVRRALEEMYYTYTESQFRDRKVPASIPAQLRFTGDVDQDTDRFHNALEERGYSPLDHRPDQTIGGRCGGGNTPYYDGEICSTETYERLRVWVGRGSVVRLFPHDDYVPSADELGQVLDAVEAGFDSTLEHEPIERDGDSE
ncbi:hypothetical protein [Natrinema versiforme]|uniref:Uncharacterized protein n=1 Tax=Natrinema versiforme JCM 10478 TaxID=1227496 RepID=L9Y7J0_9EURY|nr:hypothetical protein [Natrinema versiforme]ELY68908.1 hypothetical protein C489_06063 [Natrinema versiforme JCM 10478]